MLDRACSNTAIDTASRLNAEAEIEAAKEKILASAPTVPVPVCLTIWLLVLSMPPVVAKLTAVNDPLSVTVKADSRALLWMLIFVPPDPLLLVNMLMV